MAEAFRKTNLESSVLFLQQEHAKTLKSLHEEISKLQKKCTELTFQLTMGNLAHEDTSDPLLVSNMQQELALLKQKNQDIEKQLHIKESELETVRKKLVTLENEKEFELKMKTRQISSQELELENKAKTISDLMAELHSLKSKEAERKLAAGSSSHSSSVTKRSDKNASSDLHSSSTQSLGKKQPAASQIKPELSSTNSPPITYLLRSRTKKSTASATSSSTGSEDNTLSQKADSFEGANTSTSPRGRGGGTPMPPTDAMPKLRRRTNVKTPSAAIERENSDLTTRSTGPHRPLSGQRISISDEVIPDPSPFLTKTMAAGKPRPLSKKPKVLPPIPSRNNSLPLKDFDNNDASNDMGNGSRHNESHSVMPSRVEKLAAVEVLTLDKSDQVEVRHTKKFNRTANCN